MLRIHSLESNDKIDFSSIDTRTNESLILVYFEPATFVANLKCREVHSADAIDTWCNSITDALNLVSSSDCNVLLIEQQQLIDNWEKYSSLGGSHVNDKVFDNATGIQKLLAFYEAFNEQRVRVLFEELIALTPDNLDQVKVNCITNFEVSGLLSCQNDENLVSARELEDTQKQLESLFFKYKKSQYDQKLLRKEIKRQENRAEDLKRQKAKVMAKLKEQSNHAVDKSGHEFVATARVEKKGWKAFKSKVQKLLKRSKKATQTDPHLKLIENSSLFDSEFYLKSYPDVAKSKLSPSEHYLRFGGFENRNPSKDFNSQDYLNANQDVLKSKINPLVHYERFGREEARPLRPKS